MKRRLVALLAGLSLVPTAAMADKGLFPESSSDSPLAGVKLQFKVHSAEHSNWSLEIPAMNFYAEGLIDCENKSLKTVRLEGSFNGMDFTGREAELDEYFDVDPSDMQAFCQGMSVLELGLKSALN
jgi:hypothetical protein